MSESGEKEEHQQPSDFPTTGYEAAEEERQSLKEEEEERNTSVAEEGRDEEEEEESPPSESDIQYKRSETRRGAKRRRNNTATITTAASSAWQVTLLDLDKQLNKQSRLMERMSDDVKHLRKQFNQVQRDLLKFEKRMQKMKTTTLSSSSKKGKRRG